MPSAARVHAPSNNTFDYRLAVPLHGGVLTEFIIKPCPLAAQICCTFRPTSFSSVLEYACRIAMTCLLKFMCWHFEIPVWKRENVVKAVCGCAWCFIMYYFILSLVNTSLSPETEPDTRSDHDSRATGSYINSRPRSAAVLCTVTPARRSPLRLVVMVL